MAIKTFQRGSATYPCGCCGRTTRNTGDEGSVRLCRDCFDLAGLENTISDNGLEDAIAQGWVKPASVLSAIADLARKGGSVSNWQDLKTQIEEHVASTGKA